jgi:hypothetical protein
MDDINRKLIAGGLMSTAAFLVLCLAAVLPWYHVVNHGYTEDGLITESSFGMWRWEYTLADTTSEHPYDNPDTWMPVSEVMFAEILFVTTSMASIFMSVFGVVTARPKLAVGSGVIALALMSSGVVYFMLIIPDALNSSYGSWVEYEGFSGRGESSAIGFYSWGPLLGWYSLLVGFVVELAAVIVIELGRKGY